MFRRNLLMIGVLLIIWMLMEEVGYSSNIIASDCSQSAVQSAINSAAIGETIIVPAGSCTWSLSVSIPDSKKIALQGMSAGSTVVTWNGEGAAINLGKSGSRVSGIKIILPTGSSGYGIHLSGYGWRVDNCEFENKTAQSKMGVYVRGDSSTPDPTGLVDNCTFLNCRVNIHGNAILTAHSSWYEDYKLGSQNFIFVESCKFDRTGAPGNAIDCQYGGSYVFRHNTVINAWVEAHSADTDNGYRATRMWEVYGNSFTSTNNTYMPFRLRGGTGVVFNNTVAGDFIDPNIGIDNVRTYDGLCNGTKPIDGNQIGGWPCRDQVGRGRDQWMWTASNPYPPQASDPAFAWNNLKTDAENALVKFKVINSCNSVLAEGREFYNAQKSGYAAFQYPHPLQENWGSNLNPGTPKALRLVQ